MAFLPYLNYICSFFNKINIFSTGGQLPILVNYDQFLIFSQSEVSEVRGRDLQAAALLQVVTPLQSGLCRNFVLTYFDFGLILIVLRLWSIWRDYNEL